MLFSNGRKKYFRYSAIYIFFFFIYVYIYNIYMYINIYLGIIVNNSTTHLNHNPLSMLFGIIADCMPLFEYAHLFAMQICVLSKTGWLTGLPKCRGNAIYRTYARNIYLPTNHQSFKKPLLMHRINRISSHAHWNSTSIELRCTYINSYYYTCLIVNVVCYPLF